MADTDPLVQRRHVPRSSHGLVVDTLGRRIVSGRLAEGALLPRDEVLEAELAVSRTVIREAMKTLAAKGLIVARSRVGTSVCPRDRWNLFDADVLTWHLEEGDQADVLRQITEMRFAFEPFAAALATTRATEADIAALRDRIAGMRQAADRNAFAGADLEFHRTILAAARNSIFMSVANVIELALYVVMHRGSPVENAARQAEIADAHNAIVEAIAAGDAAAASRAMQAVIAASQERLGDGPPVAALPGIPPPGAAAMRPS